MKTSALGSSSSNDNCARAAFGAAFVLAQACCAARGGSGEFFLKTPHGPRRGLQGIRATAALEFWAGSLRGRGWDGLVLGTVGLLRFCHGVVLGLKGRRRWARHALGCLRGDQEHAGNDHRGMLRPVPAGPPEEPAAGIERSRRKMLVPVFFADAFARSLLASGASKAGLGSRAGGGGGAATAAGWITGTEGERGTWL